MERTIQLKNYHLEKGRNKDRTPIYPITKSEAVEGLNDYVTTIIQQSGGGTMPLKTSAPMAEVRTGSPATTTIQLNSYLIEPNTYYRIDAVPTYLPIGTGKKGIGDSIDQNEPGDNMLDTSKVDNCNVYLYLSGKTITFIGDSEACEYWFEFTCNSAIDAFSVSYIDRFGTTMNVEFISKETPAEFIDGAKYLLHIVDNIIFWYILSTPSLANAER